MAYQKKIDHVLRCPFEYGLQIFGGKWNARILCLLSKQRPMRFREIRGELSDSTDAVLSGALRELLREGVIRREAFNEVPPRVEYSLTEKGMSILPLLQCICQWSESQHILDEALLLTPCRQCPHRLRAHDYVTNPAYVDDDEVLPV